jgi:hypothetical protein
MPETRPKYDAEFRKAAVEIVRRPANRSRMSLETSASTRASWELGEQGPWGARRDAELWMERDVVKPYMVLWAREATR